MNLSNYERLKKMEKNLENIHADLHEISKIMKDAEYRRIKKESEEKESTINRKIFLTALSEGKTIEEAEILSKEKAQGCVELKNNDEGNGNVPLSLRSGK